MCKYSNLHVQLKNQVNLHMQLEMFNKTLGMSRIIHEVNGYLHTMKEGTRGYCRL